jgi:hypothetical protein
MKILGLLVCVLGWLIAVMSVKVPGVYVQLFICRTSGLHCRRDRRTRDP